MALSFRDKQILLYEGGYIDLDYLDTAGITDMNNLREDFLEAAKAMDKEIEAGNFITVDKQFVMNNVGMFRGIHDAGGGSLKAQVYVFNFEFQSDDDGGDVSLVFYLDTPAQHLNREIGVGLEPLKVFEQQFSDDWQFVPFLEQWGENVLNWNGRHLKELLGISE